jgi:hypothetical protein
MTTETKRPQTLEDCVDIAMDIRYRAVAFEDDTDRAATLCSFFSGLSPAERNILGDIFFALLGRCCGNDVHDVLTWALADVLTWALAAFFVYEGAPLYAAETVAWEVCNGMLESLEQARARLATASSVENE